MRKLDNFIITIKDFPKQWYFLIKYFFSLAVDGKDEKVLKAMSPEDRIRIIQDLFISVLKDVAEKNRVIFIFEDSHWLDEETLQFSFRMYSEIKKGKFILLYLTRPETVYPELEGVKGIETINLTNLNDKETADLVSNIFRCGSISKKLNDFLISKSGANPFFVRELAQLLKDEEQIIINKKTAELKETGKISIPENLNKLIISRIDKLNENLKMIIQAASVIGKDFSSRLLDSLIEFGAELSADLEIIKEKDIIENLSQELQISLTDKHDYSFRHIITRDTVYESILKKKRKEYHKKLGSLMESHYFGNLDEYLDELAYHFEIGDELKKAAEYLFKSGNKKASLFINKEAVDSYKKGFTLAKKDNNFEREKIAEAYLELGNLYYKTSDFNEAQKSFEEVLKNSGENIKLAVKTYIALSNISVDTGDFNTAFKYLEKAKTFVSGKVSGADLSLVQIEIIANECWTNRCKGDYKKAIKNGEEALERLKEILKKYPHLNEMKTSRGILELEIEIKTDLGNTYVSKGEYTKAIKILQEVLEYYTLKNDYAGLAGTYNSLGSGFNSLGENQKAEEFYLKSIEVCRKIGNRQGIARAYGNIGSVYYFRGDFKKALSMFKKEDEIAKEIGDPKGILLSTARLGALEFSLGKLKNAEDSFFKGLELAKEIGSQQDIGAFSSNLGSIYQRLHKFEKAEQFTSVFLEISRKTGDFWGEAAALNNLGSIASEQQDYLKAETMFNQAVKLARKLKEKNLLGQCLCYAGANLKSLKKYKQAEENFKESIALLISVGDNVVLVEVYGYFAELYIEMIKDPALEKEKEKLITSAKRMIEEGRKLNSILKMEYWNENFNNLDNELKITR